MTRIDTVQKRKAFEKVSSLGDILFGRREYRDYHKLRVELLRILVHMDPATQQAFRQEMPRSRGGSRRLYDDVIALVEVSNLSPDDRAVYITLDNLAYTCDRYGDDPKTFGRMHASIARDYKKVQPSLATMMAKSSSLLKDDIESRMISIDSYLARMVG